LAESWKLLFAVRRLSSITKSLRTVNKACSLENKILGCWLPEKCHPPVRILRDKGGRQKNIEK
jgi:hypothetical protein